MASGLPDVDSLSTYGGAKSDYAPVEDSTTDEAAAHRNLYAANVAAMTQTAWRAWASFSAHPTTPTIQSTNGHGAVWGNGTGVKPTVAHAAAGAYTLTWPTSVTDELGVSHTVSLRRAIVGSESATPYFITAAVTASNVVTVRVFNTAGTSVDASGDVFNVWVT